MNNKGGLWPNHGLCSYNVVFDHHAQIDTPKTTLKEATDDELFPRKVNIKPE